MAVVYLTIDGLSNSQADDVERIVEEQLRKEFSDSVQVELQDTDYDDEED